MSRPIDLISSQTFLDALEPRAATAFHFRTFGEALSSKARARKPCGTLNEVADALRSANTAGAGVFVVVNDGGDTDAEITGIRAVFLDLDLKDFDNEAKCEAAMRLAHEGRTSTEDHIPSGWPHASIVVRSGGGGWHLYWLVDDCPVTRFQAVQRALAQRFSGDSSVCNPSRVMRLPGSLHCKGDPVPVTLEKCKPERRYALNDLLSRLSVNDEAPSAELETSDFVAGRPYNDRTVADLRASLQRLDQHDPEAVHNRASWLKVIASIKAHGWGDRGKAFARDWSSQSPKFDTERFDIDWDSLKAEGDITPSTLYWMAGPESECPPAHTDDGAACRFSTWLGGRVIFARGAFHVWSGAYWQPDNVGVSALLKEYANEAAKQAQEAFRADPEGTVTKASKATAERLLNVTKQTAVLQAVRVLQHVNDSQLDRDPYLLACSNGTVDLRNGTLKPADPLDRITQCTGHPYERSAVAPAWDRFLRDAIGDDDRIDWFQRFLGYATSGDVREEVLLLTTGPGGSGKSTALNAVMHALGGGSNPHGYGTAAASALLSASSTRRNPNEHTAGLIPLVGKRLAAVNEVAVGEKWDDSMVKQLVSTEPMTMRASGGTSTFIVLPSWKIWVRGNHRPVIRDPGSGLWRRMAILEFNSPPEKKNLKLDDALRAEASGILGWLVQGCLEWQRRGLEQPALMRWAVEGFRADQDTLKEWLEACTEEGGFTTSADLLDSYIRYTRARRSPSAQAWGAMLSERGFQKRKDRKGTRGFELTLRPDSDFPDPLMTDQHCAHRRESL